MAKFLTTIKCGQKKYNISHTGKDVYFSASAKTGGNTLKGVRFTNNQIVSNNGKAMSDFDICQAIKKSKSSGECFISTAVYQSINKPDNCYELQTLRGFRDEVMLANKNWAPLVEEYYAIAPDIAEKLNKLEQSIHTKIHQNYLLPCIALIEQKRYEEAINHYKKMVASLQKISFKK